MKKSRLYLLVIVLLVSFVSLGIFSCSKKKKLTLSSLIISVTPNPASVTVGNPENFIATALRDGAPVSVDFTWSVNPITLGTITAEGIFTAGSSDEKGTVVASAEGDSGSAEVTVSGNSPNYYGILSDTYTNPSLKLDTLNPPDTDGGFLGLWPYVAPPGVPIITVDSDNTTYLEAPASSKVTITNDWAGMYIMFGYDGTADGGSAVETNMSVYSDASLKLDVKTSTEFGVSVEWTDTVGRKDSAEKLVQADLGVVLNNSWQSVSIDLSTLVGKDHGLPINFTKIKLPFAFSADAGTGTVFWIDAVRWEK